jgi:23S rRNA pseudouridine1911/1915/1917 synthase
VTSLEQPVVLHQTATWLVLAKPGGWHTVAASPRSIARAAMRGETRVALPDVESWLRDQPGFQWSRDLEEAGLVHRLDLETTGCLLVAKSAAEQLRLRAAFQGDASVRKVYLAICAAGDDPLPQRGDFRLYFSSRYMRSRKVTVSRRGAAAQEGRCAWTVRRRNLGQVPGGDLLEIELIGPGRRHQIRAGLAFLGHPILGDALYRGPAWRCSTTAAASLALHAWRLTMTGVTVTCPPPPDWKLEEED